VRLVALEFLFGHRGLLHLSPERRMNSLELRDQANFAWISAATFEGACS
jgi:hypothetical protein